MPFFDKIEQKIEKNEIALKKLIIEIERLELETSKIFHEVGISPEEFKDYTGNPSNFTQEEWELLQDQKKKLDQKLDLSMNALANPSKTAKTRSELSMSQNWLFVK